MGKISSKGLCLDLTDRKRSFELGGNRIVLSYIHRGNPLPPAERCRFCAIHGGMPAPTGILGVVLAHEIGHSLHLRHIQDEPEAAKLNPDQLRTNLMNADLQNTEGTDQSPEESTLRPFQIQAGLRYGRCALRFKGVKPMPSDACKALMEDLELEGFDFRAGGMK
jgi:hypothetical protein